MKTLAGLLVLKNRSWSAVFLHQIENFLMACLDEMEGVLIGNTDKDSIFSINDEHCLNGSPKQLPTYITANKI